MQQQSLFSTRITRGLAAGVLAAVVVGSGIAAAVSAADTPSPEHRYTNRLADSHDPYLLLHAHNPVDWYPWGPEAIAKAKAQDKPIFLSVGYSTCYWCHVAERTLYRDPAIAELMNEWFVNIKVDREQRPDIDQVYMLARQLIEGSGGWPNNVFLTPDLKPFFAGSYFPPEPDARGNPGFAQVLARINRAWTSNRRQLIEYADGVHAAMQRLSERGNAAVPGAAVAPSEWLERARARIERRFDPEHGGLRMASGPTKFPEPPTLQLLLTDYVARRDPKALRILTSALDAMAYGGLHDHLGGGFHRYSTEATWSLPHFEKMLYDNAQLLRLYAESYAALGVALYRHLAEDVGRYLSARMMAPEGGFYTALDAQVDGVEGASFVWQRAEIERVLGNQAAQAFFAVYALTPNLPAHGAGQEILAAREPGVLRVRLPIAQTLGATGHGDPVSMLRSQSASRSRLLREREARPQPFRDQKINVDLNGLAIEAFAIAGEILARPDYVEHARRAAQRVWSEAYDPATRRLMHQLYRGKAEIDGFLADYALLGRALLSLHAASGDARWRERARALAEIIIERFLDAEGGLRMTAGGSDLPLAMNDTGDDVYPSGTSATVQLLLALAGSGGGARFGAAVANILRHYAARIADAPEAWATTVAAVARPQAQDLVAGLASAHAGAVVAPSTARSDHRRLPRTADHVRIASALRQDPETVVVILAIDDGYHVNANPASFEYLIPTTLSFERVVPRQIAYPAAATFRPAFTTTALRVYQGRPSIVATFGADALANTRVLHGRVTVQACNDEICLPPSALSLDVGPPS